jgi:hypothetical protein
MHNVNNGARSHDEYWRGKAISITYAECVLPFQSYSSSMQCARAVLYSRLWPLWLHHIFLHYLSNGTIFGWGGGELTEHEMFWFSLQFLFEMLLFLRIIQRDVNVHTSPSKVQVILSDFNETLTFSTDSRKNRYFGKVVLFSWNQSDNFLNRPRLGQYYQHQMRRWRER